MRTPRLLVLATTAAFLLFLAGCEADNFRVVDEKGRPLAGVCAVWESPQFMRHENWPRGVAVSGPDGVLEIPWGGTYLCKRGRAVAYLSAPADPGTVTLPPPWEGQRETGATYTAGYRTHDGKHREVTLKVTVDYWRRFDKQQWSEIQSRLDLIEKKPWRRLGGSEGENGPAVVKEVRKAFAEFAPVSSKLNIR